jgi:hypothetical protein
MSIHLTADSFSTVLFPFMRIPANYFEVCLEAFISVKL